MAGASASYEKCSAHVGGGMRRKGIKEVAIGTVFFCTSDEDMLNSKKVFTRTLDLYAEMIGGLAEIQKLAADEVREESRRLVHNLTTLNSHIIQEIYNIVPQDDLAGTPNQQIGLIAKVISEDPAAAAQAALKILKNAVAARNEMQIVRRFRATPQLPPQLKPHMIHKVIKNVLITFFQEALERDLYWNLRATAERVWIDYELVSVALYRFFENCVKYCAPTSTIDIAFQPSESRLDVLLEMKSLPILPGEDASIFQEGFSGAMAKQHSLHGSGIGLSIVRQLLEVNDASISVSAGTRIEKIQGIEYAPNRFTLTFNRVKKL
jgi:light-regulated signal transduction histidine kinase (bacteriophytochrome)